VLQNSTSHYKILPKTSQLEKTETNIGRRESQLSPVSSMILHSHTVYGSTTPHANRYDEHGNSIRPQNRQEIQTKILAYRIDQQDSEVMCDE
jgi:hypothetical protein